MATSYDLGLAKKVPPTEILLIIKDLVGGDLVDADRLAVLPGLVVSASPVVNSLAQSGYQEDWGLEMCTSVGFDIGYQSSPDDRRTAENLMSIAAAQLAVVVDTDAGMTYQHERKLMRRQSGSLYLYDWWPRWKDAEVQARLPATFAITDEDSYM